MRELRQPNLATFEFEGSKYYPKEVVDTHIARLADLVDDLEADIQQEMAKLFKAGSISSYFVANGHFSLEPAKGDLEARLKNEIFWRKYYEEKYLELCPVEEKEGVSGCSREFSGRRCEFDVRK